MRPNCPHCTKENQPGQERPKSIRFGRFYRKSDGRWISRFRCLKCQRSFSFATLDPCYRQNKRHKNRWVEKLICSGVSLRRTARNLSLNRKTITRKLLYLASQAELELEMTNRSHPVVSEVEFDDLITCEQTKCKMVSVISAVVTGTRRIVGVDVARMPTSGRLAKISREKYGPRKDERPEVRRRFFSKIKPFIAENALIKSDESPHYPEDVKKYFPRCTHKRIKGKRGCSVGQGELKRIGFDPLFSLNHTFATQRDDLSRLRRRTWSISKKAEHLRAHLVLHALYHNRWLTIAEAKKAKKQVS